jgi:hypothetical protein
VKTFDCSVRSSLLGLNTVVIWILWQATTAAPQPERTPKFLPDLKYNLPFARVLNPTSCLFLVRSVRMAVSPSALTFKFSSRSQVTLVSDGFAGTGLDGSREAADGVDQAVGKPDRLWVQFLRVCIKHLSKIPVTLILLLA